MNRYMEKELEELESRYDEVTRLRDRLHKAGENAEMDRLSREIGYLSRRINCLKRQIEKTA